MSKLDNVRRIIAEDFKEEDRELISTLSSTINFFMDQVVETVNGNLDHDNLKRELTTVEVTVDSTGNPINNNKFSATSGAVGAVVIRATNLDNPTSGVQAAPFVSFDATQTQGIYNVRNIKGLYANNKYRLLLELIY